MKLRIAVAVTFFAVTACGPDPMTNASGIRIVLQQAAGVDLTRSLLTSMAATSTPSSLADFSCFAINVTGAGVVPDAKSTEDLRGCSSTSNFNGHGQGIVSDELGRGVPLEVKVPSGPGRHVDVYGIYPPSSQCTGQQTSGTSNGAGYLLGTKTVDLPSSQSVVTVPITIAYSGQGADVTCENHSGSTTAAPHISSVFPTAGSYLGGKTLIIVGSGFGAGAIVRLNGNLCAVTTLGPNKVACTTTSSGGPTMADVHVVNPDGQTGDLPSGYEYINDAYVAIYPYPSQNLNLSVDFGPVALSNSGTANITVENTGPAGANASPTAAYSITGSAFGYAGGSFPGTGGTCTNYPTPFAPGSCQIVLTFNPLSGTSGQLFSGSISLTYNGGHVQPLLSSALADVMGFVFPLTGTLTATRVLKGTIQ